MTVSWITFAVLGWVGFLLSIHLTHTDVDRWLVRRVRNQRRHLRKLQKAVVERNREIANLHKLHFVVKLPPLTKTTPPGSGGGRAAAGVPSGS